MKPATSSGGYGTSKNPYSNSAQRGNADASGGDSTFQDSGLVTQSTSGGDLSNETQDAKQGVDRDTRGDVGLGGGPRDGSNPTQSAREYNESLESRAEAEGKLGAPTRYTR